MSETPKIDQILRATITATLEDAPLFNDGSPLQLFDANEPFQFIQPEDESLSPELRLIREQFISAVQECGSMRYDDHGKEALMDAARKVMRGHLSKFDDLYELEYNVDQDQKTISITVVPKRPATADTASDKPSLGDADMLERFAQYYAVNPTWGSLHIVLDDGNVRDSDAEFCRSFALEHGDQEGAELAEYLMKMSKTQRLELPNRIRQV